MHEMILKSWKSLNEVLSGLREDQVKDLMEWELHHKGREDLVERLHQRYTKLRTTRERIELNNKLEILKCEKEPLKRG